MNKALDYYILVAWFLIGVFTIVTESLTYTIFFAALVTIILLELANILKD